MSLYTKVPTSFERQKWDTLRVTDTGFSAGQSPVPFRRALIAIRLGLVSIWWPMDVYKSKGHSIKSPKMDDRWWMIHSVRQSTSHNQPANLTPLCSALCF